MLLELHIAIEQQGRVILVIVAHGAKCLHVRLLQIGRLNKSLQILDEIRQVLHLDIALDDVARIEVADGLDVQVKGLLWSRLRRVHLIRMLLGDLRTNLTRELSSLRNDLSLLELRFLEQVLNLDVIVLLNELDDESLFIFVTHKQEDHVVLYFDLDDFFV